MEWLFFIFINIKFLKEHGLSISQIISLKNVAREKKDIEDPIQKIFEFLLLGKVFTELFFSQPPMVFKISSNIVARRCPKMNLIKNVT